MIPGPILIVGLGRTGRSLGLALREAAPSVRVLGHDRDPEAARAASAEGVEVIGNVTGPSLPAGLLAAARAAREAGVPIVVLALPPGEGAAAVRVIGTELALEAVLTTASSLMLPAVIAAQSIPGLLSRLVPANPVVRDRAADERGLPAPPNAGRFRGATALLGQGLDAGGPGDRVAALWRAVGAEPVPIAPTLHDALVALTHHLPQVAAAALVRTLRRTGSLTRIVVPGADEELRHATRLAALPSVASAETLWLNREKLLPALELLEREVRGLRRALAGDDEAFPRLLEEARAFRRELLA